MADAGGIAALVTGAGGMVGSHLLEALDEADPGNVLGTVLPAASEGAEPIRCTRALLPLDVRDAAAVRDMIKIHRPRAIYHLAAQSLPTVSWRDPAGTFVTNAGGTIAIFEAVRAARHDTPSYDPMVVVACSSAEYGASLTPERLPVDEEAPLLPLHPYGVSKVAQDLLAFQYWRNERIRCIRARIFNTTGPRKRDDVVSDFAVRAVAIYRRGSGSLRTGNLTTRRAILDVRDLVAALCALAARGEPGEAYNICSPTAVEIGALVPLLEQIIGVRLPVAADPALFRPADEPVIVGRTDKLHARTGWRARIPLADTVRAIVDHEMRRPVA